MMVHIVLYHYICSVRILLSEIQCCFGEVTRATDPLFVAIRNAQSAHRNYIVTMAKIQLAFVQVGILLMLLLNHMIIKMHPD